jgi:DNA-directed RNA polymerase beta' subunit
MNKKYHKDKSKEWREKHPIRHKMLMKENYEKNKDKRKHYSRVYSSERKMEESYNRPVKNIIRNKIIEEISRKNIKNILTLESSEFLFTKQIPEKKLYVYEKDKKVFDKMNKTKPKNVILNYGDVSDFSRYDFNVDCIYLDFCGSYTTEKEIIYNLKEKIRNSKLFVITLCTWDETKKPNGDYQFDLINKLQTLLEVNFKVLFGQGYRDNKHSTMVTIILENTNV